MKRINGSAFLFLFWLLFLVAFTLVSNFSFSISYKINDVGDGLCDICGAPATYEHFYDSGRRETLLGEYCDSHSFPHGEFYTQFLFTACLFTGIMALFSFYWFCHLSDEPPILEIPTRRSIARLFLPLLSAVIVLIIWFGYQVSQNIQNPDSWIALGCNALLLIVHLGIILL